MDKYTSSHSLAYYWCPSKMKKNVYIPLVCPISATPAAEPIDSMLPPTPAVK